jgi:hypothetical protein
MSNIDIKDTETIDRLFLELSQFTSAKTKTELKYYETALRYIREAEAASKTGEVKEEAK